MYDSPVVLVQFPPLLQGLGSHASSIFINIVWRYIYHYITTNVVSSNPAHGNVYSIQHYMIKFVSDVRENDGFLQVVLKFCLWQIDSYKCAFWCKCIRSLCLFRTSQPDITLDVYNVTCYTTMDYGICQHFSNISCLFSTSICPNMFLFDCLFVFLLLLIVLIFVYTYLLCTHFQIWATYLDILA